MEKDRKEDEKMKTRLAAAAFTLCAAILIGCTDSGISRSSGASDTKEKASENMTASDDNDLETKNVSFCAVGDNLIHETIYKEADGFSGGYDDGKYDFTPFYSEVKDDIKAFDIAFINQETIVGGYDLGLSGYPVFNSPNEVVPALKETGFDMVNTATNHSLDKGQEGIDNAVSVLDKNSLCHDGVYSDESDMDKIRIIEKNGIKVALVSFTESTNGIELPNDYSLSTFDDEYIKKKISAAKTVADVVLVSAHWGTENSFNENDSQKYYSKYFADCGADIIIGTHPHTIQPIKWITADDGRKVLCAYSLGNFLGGMLSFDNVLSGMVSFDIKEKDNRITVDNVKWTPLVIHFEGDKNNIMDSRKNYKVYKLSDYTDKLSKKHILNGYEGNEISVEHFWEKTKEVINSEFLQ